MNEICIAVVGVGRMGLTHAENLARRVQGARLVAVTTSDEQRAAEARACCGDIAVYPTLDALLAAGGLDAVCISSSTSAHTDNVEQCAAAGLDIFCEKPLALTLADCDRAIAATEQAGTRLMIGHVRKFDAGHVEAKRYIEAGAIGKPLVFRAISGDVDPPPPSFADPAVSGGLILDGRLYHGATGMAGEIGHTTILPDGPLCGCGNRGCLEALASGSAIARRARERVVQGVPTRIADLAGHDLELITAKLVTEAARDGDVEAQEILAEAMNYLGIGMAGLVNLLNPELIVIGGGLTHVGEQLFGPVRRAIDRHAFAAQARAVRIVRAELGDHAGVLGAAAVAWCKLADQ